MRSIILSALLMGIVSAQSLQGLPLCAYSCVENSIPASCNYDPKCICSATSFIAGVTCCVTKACDEADQQATLKYAKGICSPAGVTLTQTAATCTTTGAAGNSSSSGTTSMTSGSSTSLLASGEVTSSISSSTASVSSSISSVISSVSSGASSAGSAAATSAAGAEQLLTQQGANVFAAIVAAAALL